MVVGFSVLAARQYCKNDHFGTPPVPAPKIENRSGAVFWHDLRSGTTQLHQFGSAGDGSDPPGPGPKSRDFPLGSPIAGRAVLQK